MFAGLNYSYTPFSEKAFLKKIITTRNKSEKLVSSLGYVTWGKEGGIS